MLCPVLVLRAFSWPDDISLCGQSTLGLSICLWMDIWAITSHASMNTRVQVSFKQFYLFVYFWLSCSTGFSLVPGSGGYSPVVVCGLLIVVDSFVAEHTGCRVCRVASPDSREQAR